MCVCVLIIPITRQAHEGHTLNLQHKTQQRIPSQILIQHPTQLAKSTSSPIDSFLLMTHTYSFPFFSENIFIHEDGNVDHVDRVNRSYKIGNGRLNRWIYWGKLCTQTHFYSCKDVIPIISPDGCFPSFYYASLGLSCVPSANSKTEAEQ